ncbi:MAG: glucose-6-phosphate isomerase [Oscillospiraceae bacterium]
MSITVDLKYVEKFVSSQEFAALSPRVLAAQSVLNLGLGKGNNLLGWKEREGLITPNDLEKVLMCSEKIRKDSDAVVIIGTGGSYIGARAAIDWLKTPNYNLLTENTPKIFFLGTSISALSINEVLEQCENKRLSVIAISKSGETLETAMTFRIMRQYMEKCYGEEAASRIYIVTNGEKSTFKIMAEEKGYDIFVIPENVGGRFSIATCVGLLPMAIAGIDIKKFLDGIEQASKEYCKVDATQNPALIYALLRFYLYQKGFISELFCGWDDYMVSTLEWLRQLFAESEGKERRGLFPSFANYSGDLHSLGQFVQQGPRVLFETMLSVEKCGVDIDINTDTGDFDELNFLDGKTLEAINREAQKAVAGAHNEGGTPVIRIILDNKSPEDFGSFIYFMEYSASVSAYLLGVNPFDQPGVENYKKIMFGLLGKPGFDKPTIV